MFQGNLWYVAWRRTKTIKNARNNKNYRSFYRNHVTLKHILHGMNDIFHIHISFVRTFVAEILTQTVLIN